MKRCFAVVLIFVVLCAGAAAQKPFADVPKGHWAYDCVRSLAEKGFVMAYPDGTFGGRQLMTRYEFAYIVARSIPIADKEIESMAVTCGTLKTPLLNADDFDCLDRMADEFTPELRVLQVNIEALHGALRRLRFAALASARRASPLAVSSPFPDVPRGHWAYNAVCLLADRGLMKGYPE
jgi:hypothetical protein